MPRPTWTPRRFLSALLGFAPIAATAAAQPTATVVSLPNITSFGGTSLLVQVRYADPVGINVGTIGLTDLMFAGPNGYMGTPLSAMVDQGTNGTPRIATYSFIPPGGSWDAGDAGVYVLSIGAGAVSNTAAVAVPAGTLGAFFVGAVVPGAVAPATWNETGPDAPQTLPGDVISGSGALTRINGTIGHGLEADVYCIRISNRAGFSATTVGQTTLDTQLFLFDSTGKGVTFNDDDAVSGTNRSRITGQFVPAAGVYFLAISGYDYDATTTAGEIWTDEPFTGERAPNGPGAAGVLSGWSGGSASVSTYGIVLTGAEFHLDTSPAKCPPNFAAAPILGGINAPQAVATSDLNADGRLDLVTANDLGDNVSVLLGNGDGTFQPLVNYPTGDSARWVAIGDVNSDGKPDLAVANRSSSNLSVLLGNGNGTFQAAVNHPTGIGPHAVAIGDVNGDGRPDLVTANRGGSSVSVLLGAGAGAFSAAVNHPAGAGAESVVIADLNGDGKPDLAVANYSESAVSVLLGNGSGAFPARVAYPTGGFPSGVVSGDFNRDGILDLAESIQGIDALAVLLGNGNGTFQAAVLYATGASPRAVAAGDLNGDGALDLIASNQTNNNVLLLLGNGNGTFQTVQNFVGGNGPYGVAIADINADGKLDVATANYSGSDASVLLQQPGIPGPTITTHPSPRTVLTGDSTSFTVAATSATPLTYQWRRNGVNLMDVGEIAGSQTPTLQISPVFLGEDASAFDCVVTNACGSTTCKPAGIAVTWRCAADFNQSGVKDVTDIFVFLTAWFGNCP